MSCRCIDPKHCWHRPGPGPIVPYKDTRDIEYREAAARLAIAHFEAKGMKTTLEYEIIRTAQMFEQYLRNG